MIKMKTNNKNKKAIRYFILTLTLMFACSIFSLTAFAVPGDQLPAGEQITNSDKPVVVSGTSSVISSQASSTSSSSNSKSSTSSNSSSSSKSSISSKTSSTPASSKPAVSSKKAEESVDDSSSAEESELTIVDLDPGASSRLASEVSSSAAVVKPAEVEGFFTPMLVGGIALVLLGLAGFGFFIYLQCFSKGNTMADITQQAKRDAKRYQRGSTQRPRRK